MLESFYACLEKGARNLFGQARSTIAPLRYLWPWLITTTGFIAFLGSAQGDSLAFNFSQEPLQPWMVVVFNVLYFCITILGVWFAATASSAFRSPSPSVFSTDTTEGSWAVGRIAIWAAVFSIAPLAAFSLATKSVYAAITCLALAAITWLYVHSFAQTASGKSTSWNFVIPLVRRHRFIFAIALLLLSSVPLLIGALISNSRPTLLSSAGPLLLTLVGFSCIATLVATIMIGIPRCFNAPILGWVFVLCLIAKLIFHPISLDGENPLLIGERTKATPTEAYWADNCAETKETVSHQLAWRRFGEEAAAEAADAALIRRAEEQGKDPEKINLPLFDPVYLVSAEGGGIRAAYWTAVGLAQMDIATNDKFASQVISLSGVSGGSLGVATWLAAHEIDGLTPSDRLQLIEKFLGGDFLSPLIGGLIFLDFPRIAFGSLWPVGSRDHVFERAVFDRWHELSGSDFFARPMRRLCLHNKSFSNGLAVFFGATDATWGRPVELSNIGFSQQNLLSKFFPNSLDFTSLRWMTVAQAVSISARFPFLSPGAEVGVNLKQIGLAFAQKVLDNEPDTRPGESLDQSIARRAAEQAEIDAGAELSTTMPSVARIATLVDGGYYDNSGLLPTIEGLEDVRHKLEGANNSKKKEVARQPLRVLHFSNDPGFACFPDKRDSQPSEKDDVQEFLNAVPTSQRCDYEYSLAKRALAASPFQFLSTPFESIFSVRTQHALAQIEAVERQYFPINTALGELAEVEKYQSPSRRLYKSSLARELAEVKASPPERDFSFMEESWRIEASVILKKSEEKRIALLRAAETASRPIFQRRMDQLEEWTKKSLETASKWNCANESIANRPPLGWALNVQDRKLLQCLSARSAIRSGFPSLRPPWDEDVLFEFTDVGS